MDKKRTEKKRRRPTAMDIWRMVLAIVGIVAIVQELRKPSEERTWHGKVADLIPYDFRMPTVERIRDTYWNPDGPTITGKAFGVGWAFNFGSLTKVISRDNAA